MTRHYWINPALVPPTGSGGTRHYEFAERLRERGLDMRLIGCDFSLKTRSYGVRASAGDLRAIERDHGGVPITWLHAPPYSGNDWRRAAHMAGFAASVFRHLLRVPIDADTVFIGSSPYLPGAAAAAAAARLRGVRFVFEIRDMWPESLVELLGRETAMTRILRPVADALYRQAEANVILAAGNRDRLRERGVEDGRIHWIPNGIDPQRMKPGRRRRKLSSDGRFRLVYAGAHGVANDLDVVIDAATLLRDRGRDEIVFLLVGDGPEKARLVAEARRRALENLEFRDPIPKAEIPALLDDASVGLHTLKDVPLFRSGVSPNKLFDYMSMCLPVLTNVPGECAALVDGSGAGVVAAPGDPASLAEAAEALCATPARALERMGRMGRAHVVEHYNRDTLTDVWENLLARDGADP